LKQERIIGKSYLPRLIFAALGIFVFSIAVSALLLYLEICQPIGTHYTAALCAITDIRDTLIIKTLKISAISSLLIILGLMALVILYTHRIAGPLYRIKVCAKAIGEGRLGTRVKFRQKDVIHPFAESLNEMTDHYGIVVKSFSLGIHDLKIAVTNLKSLTEDGKDTEAALKEALDRDRQIKGLLDSIKI